MSFFAIISGVAFLLFGCPLESLFPLAPANECRLDQSLIGTWKSKENNEGSPLIMRMYPFNDYEILIVSEKEPDMLSRAYTTIICGKRFLNVQDINAKSPSGRTWTFAHYSIAGNTLSLWILSNKLFRKQPPSDSGELRRLIEETLGNHLLFMEEANPVLFERIDK